MSFHGLLNIFMLSQLEESNRRYNEKIRLRTLRDSSNPFSLPDAKFVGNFRLTKDMANYLLVELGPHLRVNTRATGVSVNLRIFTALYFFAHGSYQKNVGAHYQLGIKQPTVSRIVGQVCDAMVEHLLKVWVVFPKNEQSRKKIQERFYEKSNFPGVIGAIDGTHIAIIAPPTDDPTYPGHAYYNPNGYYSINATMICDSDLHIIYCNARFPGSCHDAEIWSDCAIKRYLQRLYSTDQLQSWLIGDSDYDLQPWLLTPIEDAANDTPECRYTTAHIKARTCIERCFRILRQRFRCLLKNRTLHYNPTKAGKIIYCCVILHNMCLLYDMDDEIDDELFHETPVEKEVRNEDEEWLGQGQVIRNGIIERHFS